VSKPRRARQEANFETKLQSLVWKPRGAAPQGLRGSTFGRISPSARSTFARHAREITSQRLRVLGSLSPEWSRRESNRAKRGERRSAARRTAAPPACAAQRHGRGFDPSQRHKSKSARSTDQAPLKWSRRESNPRPRIDPSKRLRAYSTVLYFSFDHRPVDSPSRTSSADFSSMLRRATPMDQPDLSDAP
jgi:hypothetical protein